MIDTLKIKKHNLKNFYSTERSLKNQLSKLEVDHIIRNVYTVL